MQAIIHARRVIATIAVSLLLAAASVAGSFSTASAATDDSPRGSISFVSDSDGTVQAVGWAFDPSAFGEAVQVTIRVDGTPLASAYADYASDYLYGFGVPGRHGFWTAFRLTPGEHTLCASYRNIGGGQDVSAACESVAVPDRSPADWPSGDFSVTADNDTGRLVVMGWAFDRSHLNASIDVDVYINGTHRGRWRAGMDSSYLYPYGVPGRHAFLGAVPAVAGTHEVCVIARDRAPGTDGVLGCRNVVAAPIAHNPEGQIAISMNPNGSVNIRGWALDRNDMGATVRLGIFQNGVLTGMPWANAPSPELAAYGLFSKGIDLRLPPATRGAPFSLCVLGVNVALGSDSWLACSTIDARGTTPVADRSTAWSFTVLVNKKNPLSPARYTPPLISMSSVGVAGGQSMRPEAAYAIRDMFAQARASGISLTVASGFRSFESQAAIHSRQIASGGRAFAETLSARPGHSEHQTGLAADVTAPAEGCAISACFGYTNAGRWLAANSWKYGFIIRYPNGATGITGYVWEPWHLRFVGAEVAREMYDGGIGTYEEYLGVPAAPTY